MGHGDRRTNEWSLPQGHVLSERYEIGAEIGRGGMGAVYAARDRLLERPVAIKFLFPERAGDAEAIARFQREALAAGKIGHENICDVRDRGETEEGAPFIVMEKLEGRSLADIYEREAPLAPERITRLVRQVLAALSAAHGEGIIHRDLKPANIFVTMTADGDERVKLLDFGIAKFTSDSHSMELTRSGAVLGTPLYMSPEQALGHSDIDLRTDLWSVGAVMYEGLCARTPFAGDNYNAVIASILTRDPVEPSVLVPEIPSGLEAVVIRALSRDAEDRYANAAEFIAALKDALAEPGSLADTLSDVVETEGAAVPVDPYAATQDDLDRPVLRLPIRVALVVAAVALVSGIALFLGTWTADDAGARSEEPRGTDRSAERAAVDAAASSPRDAGTGGARAENVAAPDAEGALDAGSTPGGDTGVAVRGPRRDKRPRRPGTEHDPRQGVPDAGSGFVKGRNRTKVISVYSAE